MRHGRGDDAATAIVAYVVHPGREEDFAAWAEEVDAAVAEWPGHRTSVRLHDGSGLNHVVHQFETKADLDAWESSTRRRELRRSGEDLADEHHTAAGGSNPWFEVPGRDAPARWRTFALTWAAVYPTLLVISGVIAVLGVTMPYLVELAVSSAVLTALLTWLILPWVEREARPWLLRGARPRRAARQPRNGNVPASSQGPPT